jgi:hypothetical protein
MASVVELDVLEPNLTLAAHGVEAVACKTEAPNMGEQVYLNEERARVELKRTSIDADATWYLDTGASNHMTGDESVFSELDKNVSGKVRFGDGSVVDIHRRGIVLFAIDDERHRALSL